MKRYDELDSIRGLAALTVIFCHFLLVFPVLDYLNNKNYEFCILKYTPLHLLWAGHEAVILFFTLSGFVLSLPFFSNKQADYITFLTKRICRVYLPYIVAVILSFAGCVLFYNGDIDGLSKWINGRWDAPISLKTVIAHASLILIPSYSANEYNPALWSLIHEMRISIVFPAIMFFIKRVNWKLSIIFGSLISIIGFVGRYIGLPYIISDFFFTMQYLIMFIVGSLLAKHKDYLHGLYSGISIKKRGLMVVFGILCYTYGWWFFYEVDILHFEIINDFVITVGTAVFIFISISSKAFSSILLLKPVHFLGKISYSLYLLHGVVLLSLLHVLNKTIPVGVILVISFVMTILASTISYYIVERPSIKLGRVITNRGKDMCQRDDSIDMSLN